MGRDGWEVEGAKRFGWFKAYSFHQDVLDGWEEGKWVGIRVV